MPTSEFVTRFALVALIAALLAVAVLAANALSQTPTTPAASAAGQDRSGWKKLTPEEEYVIARKGTERAFSGEYWNHKAKGTYACRRCSEPLFRSDDKFDSRTGWPSFDKDIPGKVRQLPDADGMRTEIVCANCDGHLGDVFFGEGFTPANTRHCVNSLSLQFIPEGKMTDSTTTTTAAGGSTSTPTNRAIFAGGCFWGVEHYFKKEPGVLETTVGFSGGHKVNPTYKEVCYTDTGHAEVIEVVFDPAKTSFEKLAKLFFEIHDPTQLDRQGPDIGPQYRSAVYYLDAEQKRITEQLIATLKAKGYKVVTEVAPAGPVYPAEDYHQDYYEKTGKTPYCHFYTKRF